MELFGPRVGVGVLIRRGDEVLLIRRRGVHGSGTWSTPGGHLDPGEDLAGCAVREASEETGVAVRDVRFRAITNDLFHQDGRHYVTVWMEGLYDGGEPSVNAEYEMSAVRWFPWDALPNELFLSLSNLVESHCHPPERGGLESLRRGLPR